MGAIEKWQLIDSYIDPDGVSTLNRFYTRSLGGRDRAPVARCSTLLDMLHVDLVHFLSGGRPLGQGGHGGAPFWEPLCSRLRFATKASSLRWPPPSLFLGRRSPDRLPTFCGKGTSSKRRVWVCSITSGASSWEAGRRKAVISIRTGKRQAVALTRTGKQAATSTRTGQRRVRHRPERHKNGLPYRSERHPNLHAVVVILHPWPLHFPGEGQSASPARFQPGCALPARW